MSNKEEQSEAYIKPTILGRNNHLEDDNWKLGLDYVDFTGYEVQCAFEAGWDACEAESVEIIKTAEDHAYFAGSEAMREKLTNKVSELEERIKIAEDAFQIGSSVIRKRIINKVSEFVQDNIREYHKSGVFHVAEFIKDLRKAMEEE